MIILAIDTTNEVGGVGIFQDSESLARVPNPSSADKYSITLFQMVEQALAQAQLKLSQVDLYAVANGPGSFTGIRVGLAAARAWARVFDRPVRGVSVLEAMIHSTGIGEEKSARANWYVPLVDARRGEFFVSKFRGPAGETDAGEGVQSHASAEEGWVLKPDAVRALLLQYAETSSDVTCVARTHDHAANDFCSSLPAGVNCRHAEGILVGAIAALAAAEHRSGSPIPASKLDAYYIRRPDAEVKLMNE